METSQVIIRAPELEDAEAFLEAVHRSRELHASWIHPPLTARDYELYLERFETGENVSRLVCHSQTNELVGLINLNNIIRGFFQNSFLGFYAFSPHQGTGLMQRGFRLVLTEAFGPLELHRVEANIQPDNQASINFVRRAGFRKEGYSPRYLRIAGSWKDHERWALLAEDFQPSTA